jgi:hypothetical protein
LYVEGRAAAASSTVIIEAWSSVLCIASEGMALGSGSPKRYEVDWEIWRGRWEVMVRWHVADARQRLSDLCDRRSDILGMIGKESLCLSNLCTVEH